MTQPSLSVIIPCYNGAKFVEKSINSALAQDADNLTIEIIVVNDGSTDNSAKIIAGIAADHNNVHLVNQSNQGLSAARNTGLRHAKSDYILFLDADDFISPNCLGRLCSEAIAANADIVKFNTRFAKPSDCITPPQFNNFSQIDAINYLNTYRAYAIEGAVWRVIFRREFLINNNLWFNTDIKISEDNLYMMAALAHCGKMIETQTICHHYVQHGDNWTQQKISWEKSADLCISRSEEVMKLYLSDKKFFDHKGLRSVFEYTSYDYSYQAIMTAVNAGASSADVNQIIRKLTDANTYPMLSVLRYREYISHHQPVAQLKWTMFRHPVLVRICAKLHRVINRFNF